MGEKTATFKCIGTFTVSAMDVQKVFEEERLYEEEKAAREKAAREMEAREMEASDGDQGRAAPFDASELLTDDVAARLAGRKLAAHVLFVNDGADGVAECVDLYMPYGQEDLLETAFSALSGRVNGLRMDCGMPDIEYFKEVDPGCNVAIFVVKFGPFVYQLNFVELK